MHVSHPPPPPTEQFFLFQYFSRFSIQFNRHFQIVSLPPHVPRVSAFLFTSFWPRISDSDGEITETPLHSTQLLCICTNAAPRARLHGGEQQSTTIPRRATDAGLV